MYNISNHDDWEGILLEQQIKDIISACDLAIQNEDFDTLMNYYTEDAVLVVKPGMIARGKEEIKKRLWQSRTISIIILSRHKGNDHFGSRRHCTGPFSDTA